MKGFTRSMSRGRVQSQTVHKLTLPIRNKTIEIDGAAGVGFGSLAFGELPQGNLLLLGAVAYIQLTGPGSASLIEAWEGDFAIGSAPTADAALAGAEVDIIPSTPIGPAVAEASPRTRAASIGETAGVVLDNTDDALELNLNVLVDDTSISANDIILTVSGELYLSFVVLGDD